MIYHLYPMVHQGFNNRMFKVTAVHVSRLVAKTRQQLIFLFTQRFPFTIKDASGNWTGLCFDIVDELARILNFR
jgi:hypothetical protein